MPRDKGEPPAIRVYTVCDESRYLIVRNVPALGCGDELGKLFASYGEIQECKPMDAEECEAFTDVYWIKFSQVGHARFAKRKLDEYVFLGNRLQISYAPQFESLSDVKEKLEGRRNEVLRRIKCQYLRFYAQDLVFSFYYPYLSLQLRKRCLSNYVLSFGFAPHGMVLFNTDERTGVSHSISEVANDFHKTDTSSELGQASSVLNVSQNNYRKHAQSTQVSFIEDPCISHVSSNKEYFKSSSMNETVRLVRDKLHKITSSSEHVDAGPSKKTRVDNRRRI